MALRVTDLGPGVSPTRVLRTLDEHARAAGTPGPVALIGDWLGADAVIAPSLRMDVGVRPPTPATGFWIGCLAYPDRLDEGATPAVVGGTTDAILVYRDGRWAHHSTGARCPQWLRDSISDDATTIRPDAWSATWTPPPRPPHDAAIRSCLDAIAAGEIYQACVCTRYTGHLTGRPVDFFIDGVESMAPRKAAFLGGSWGAVTSFSPETFVRVDARTIASSPIKGTVPSSQDPAVLAASVKDVAENVMIVDLVRNDLGRIAVPGTVTVPELLVVHPAPGVWHLVSTVAARVPDEVGVEAVLEATFPPGSVTGAPKIRTRELLAQWENNPRGVYCGAIGVATPDGDLDLNVAIRTVEIGPDGSMALGVGGGITIDSDPDREWQECLDKAASIVTLRWRRGRDDQRRSRTA